MWITNNPKMFWQPSKLSLKSLECFCPVPEVTSLVARPISYFAWSWTGKLDVQNASRNAGILSLEIIDQFWYIKIQSNTKDFSTRLWGINHTNSVFIPQSLVLRPIVLGWILIYGKFFYWVRLVRNSGSISYKHVDIFNECRSSKL